MCDFHVTSGTVESAGIDQPLDRIGNVSVAECYRFKLITDEDIVRTHLLYRGKWS